MPDNKFIKTETRGMLLAAVGVLLFGLTLPITRHIANTLHPVFIGLGRAVLASFAAMIVLLITKQSIPKKEHLYKLAIIALTSVLGFPVLIAWAMQRTLASHGAVILGLLPLATAIASCLFTKKRPSLAFWISSFIGSTIVVFYSVNQATDRAAESVSQFLYFGDFILFLAVISAGIGYALGGELSRDLSGWKVISWSLVLSLPFIIIPAFIYRPISLQDISLDVYLSFLYLALVSQFFGFFFWYKGLALGGVARVSQIQLLQPFVTIFAAAYLLDESLDFITFVFVIVLASIIYIGKKTKIN